VGCGSVGLPVYHYTDDEATDPNAAQPETTRGGSLTMRVTPPPGVSAAQAVSYVGTKQVPTSVVDGLVRFTLKTSAGKVAD